MNNLVNAAADRLVKAIGVIAYHSLFQWNDKATGAAKEKRSVKGHIAFRDPSIKAFLWDHSTDPRTKREHTAIFTDSISELFRPMGSVECDTCPDDWPEDRPAPGCDAARVLRHIATKLVQRDELRSLIKPATVGPVKVSANASDAGFLDESSDLNAIVASAKEWANGNGADASAPVTMAPQSTPKSLARARRKAARLTQPQQ